jgi:hypothetical protein
LKERKEEVEKEEKGSIVRRMKQEGVRRENKETI